MEAKILEKILIFLSYRPRSVREAEGKLSFLFKRYKLEDTEKFNDIINTFKNQRLLDDKENIKIYFQGFVVSSKPRSIRNIKTTLLKKGFPEKLIESQLSNFEKDFEFENALKLVEKKFGSAKPVDYVVKNKAIKYLMSKGYTYSTAQTVFDSMRSVK